MRRCFPSSCPSGSLGPFHSISILLHGESCNLPARPWKIDCMVIRINPTEELQHQHYIIMGRIDSLNLRSRDDIQIKSNGKFLADSPFLVSLLVSLILLCPLKIFAPKQPRYISPLFSILSDKTCIHPFRIDWSNPTKFPDLSRKLRTFLLSVGVQNRTSKILEYLQALTKPINIPQDGTQPTTQELQAIYSPAI